MKLVISVIKLILVLVFGLLTALLPRRKGLVVFGAWFGHRFADNPKYLFLSMLENKSELNPIWLTRSREVYLKYKNIYPVYLSYSLRGIYYSALAEYLIVACSFFDAGIFVSKATNIINLWHGAPLKKIIYDDISYKTDVTNLFDDFIYDFYLSKITYFATSKTIKEIFITAFKTKKIEIFGQCRNDIFFNMSFNKDLKQENDQVNQYKLNSQTRIISYLPTHRKTGQVLIECSKIFDLELLNEFCLENNLIFLIKKHYFHVREVENLDKYNNIVDITSVTFDTMMLLKNTDILITDYSSVYIDYLLSQRPIIFYSYDYENYKTSDRDLYFDYDDVIPSKRSNSFSELMMQLDEVLSDYSGMCRSNQYKNCLEVFMDSSVRGAASDKIIKKLESREL